MADLISRKVVCLLASHDTQIALRAWAEEQGFDLATDYDGNARPADQFDFHVTLVASANEVSVPETQFKPHLSLSYAWDGTPDLDDLQPPDIPLLFDQLRGASLDALSPSKSWGELARQLDSLARTIRGGRHA